jgi:hypothetical protein
MWIKPNNDRLQSLDVTSSDKGKIVLFCPACSFQLEPGSAARPICPDCGNSLHTTKITAELLDIMKEQKKDRVGTESVGPSISKPPKRKFRVGTQTIASSGVTPVTRKLRRAKK